MSTPQPTNDNDNNNNNVFRRLMAKVDVKVDSPVHVTVVICPGGDGQRIMQTIAQFMPGYVELNPTDDEETEC